LFSHLDSVCNGGSFGKVGEDDFVERIIVLLPSPFELICLFVDIIMEEVVSGQVVVGEAVVEDRFGVKLD